MHLGPIPQQTSQYAVFVLTKAAQLPGQEDLYEKVGLEWPTLEAAEAFQQSYESGRPHMQGKTIIVEKTTNWVVISDYTKETKWRKKREDAARIPQPRGEQKQFHDTELRGR